MERVSCSVPAPARCPAAKMRYRPRRRAGRYDIGYARTPPIELAGAVRIELYDRALALVAALSLLSLILEKTLWRGAQHPLALPAGLRFGEWLDWGDGQRIDPDRDPEIAAITPRAEKGFRYGVRPTYAGRQARSLGRCGPLVSVEGFTCAGGGSALQGAASSAGRTARYAGGCFRSRDRMPDGPRSADLILVPAGGMVLRGVSAAGPETARA
jgi:hypothetical protein